MKQLDISQLIILIKSIIISKRDLMTKTPSIKTNQVMIKTYNAK